MTKADKALAAVLAAATLAGGVGPAALAEEATTPAPDAGTQDTTTTSRLDAAIDRAGGVDPTRDWTADTKAAFDKALEKAKTVRADNAATQETVDKAAVALETATANLTTTQRANLQAAKDRVSALGGDEDVKNTYTDATYEALKAALGTANGPFEDSKAGDGQAQIAADNLDKAREALVTRAWDRLNTQVNAAQTEADRGLTYPGNGGKAFERALGAAENALKHTGANDAADAAGLNEPADALEKALGDVKGKSTEQADFQTQYDKVKGRKPDKYKDSDDFAKALEQAGNLDKDTASASEFKALTEALKKGESLKVNAWTVGGVDLTETSDGKWTATLGEKTGEQLKQLAEATGADGTKVALKDTDTGRFTQGGAALGVGTVEHHLTGTAPDGAEFDVTVPVTHGSKTTAALDKGTPIEFVNRDGKWTAVVNGDNLLGSTPAKDGTIRDATAWEGHTLTLSDGTELKATLGEAKETHPADAPLKTIWTRDVAYTGKDANGTSVAVTITASRTYDATARLKVTATDAENRESVVLDTGALDIRQMKDSYTLPALDRTLIGSRYRATLDVAGADGAINVTNGIGANGERTFAATGIVMTLDGTAIRPVERTVRVSVPFTAPKRETTNTAARLEGFRVDGGTLSPSFDPDVLDYTIRLKEGRHVSVTPMTPDGVRAVAGDVAQTAYTTVQSWTVTAANGERRVYTVTVIRDHATKTADEAVTPKDAQGITSDIQAPTTETTDVRSWGYMLGGKYTPVASDTFRIPEGGVLAYESYAGQTVNVAGTRAHGMTWDYELGVLAPDGETYGSHTLRITYITPDTHRAGLTGIRVDGRDVKGFSPETREYTVAVADPTQYVVSPQFDRMTGMSVSTHKTDSTATVTATSADGLVRAVYTLRIVKATVGSALAETGATVGVIAAVVALFAAVGVALARLARRRDADDTEPATLVDDGLDGMTPPKDA